MAKIAGIDLGTTFSAISRLNDMDRPEVIPNADGERITSSSLYFDENKKIDVGAEALNGRKVDASRSVRWIKAHMGDADHRTSIDGKEYTPAELSALILKKLHQDAIPQVGEITDVVISVPANFGEVARKATMDAGKIAGLNVIGIVNEPTAAALYYAITHEIAGRMMVFDLGGGTFDVSVANVAGQGIDIVTSCGAPDLGGSHFDQKLLEYFEKKYKEETGGEMYSTPEERAEFEDYAEEAKKSLSKKETFKFRLKGEGGTVRGEITRSEFESLISSDIARIEMLIETVLDEAELEASDVEKVLLAGGSSRIPAVQRLLKEMFGYEPTLAGNVDECVSLGAALYAGLRLGKVDMPLGEVCNASYGTTCMAIDEVLEKDVPTNDILIKKNSKIPCEVSKTYFTRYAGQEVINGKVTQGESSDPDLVQIRAEGSLKLPSDLPQGTPIDITYSYDKDQRMNCIFEHKDSRTKLVVNLDIESGSSTSETIEDQQAKIEDLIID